jgi:hypothetical protein
MQKVFLPKRNAIAVMCQCALAALICAVFAGCGTAASQPGQAAGSGQHSTSPPGDYPCAAAHLAIAIDDRAAGVAAGTALIPLDFTNVSASSCRLTGYAYVSFATSDKGQRIGQVAAADRALPPHTLLLGAGKTAHLWLRMVAAANLPASICRPTTAGGLQIRLPGQSASTFLAHRFLTCANRVKGTDILTVEPFQSGRARAGTAQ